MFWLLIVGVVRLVRWRMRLWREGVEQQTQTELEGWKQTHKAWLDEKQRQLDIWRAREEAAIVARVEQQARSQAEVRLQEWKLQEEDRIRTDAVLRSTAVMKGKSAETFLPLMTCFPYNSSDTRFLGSPVDLIVFDGLSDGEVKEVVFIEAKTGRSQLTKRESEIRDAIQNKRVKWIQLRIGDEREAV